MKKVKSNQSTLSIFISKINFFFIVLQVYKSPGGLEQTQLQIYIPAKNELWVVFYGICTELETQILPKPMVPSLLKSVKSNADMAELYRFQET